MSETTFTPGPWAEHGKGGCPCGLIYGPDGNALIATVYGPDHLGHDGPDCVPNRPSQIANASLIAAAPTMYEALDHVEAVLSIVVPRSHMAEYVETLAQVRAALTKARGAMSGTNPQAHPTTV